MLRFSDNPPMLPRGASDVSDLVGDWWVLHTRPRFEKSLAWDLFRRGIDYFLPMLERVTISGGRKRRVLTPLFSNYMFLRGSREDRRSALATNRVVGTIDVANQRGLTMELATIEKLLTQGVRLAPYLGPPVGQRCRVKGGPFRDVEGVVVSRDRHARIVIRVSIIGQGAAMEIDCDLVEPLPQVDGAP